MNPFVFIIGCARSGTTLLRRIVNAHPRIAITQETHWIPGFFEKRIGLTPEGQVTLQLVAELLDYDRFPRLKIDREQLERLFHSGPAVSYADFIAGIFDLYGQARGKSLVGDKTPGYVRDIGTLHGLWPEAKFVHLIRDGRDVSLSAINWKGKGDKLARRFSTWGEHPVTTAAVWWKWRVALGREGGQWLGPDLYYELRYEALVARPAQECARLCAFLDVPYDEAMLRFHEGHTKDDPTLDAKRAWRPITPGLRDWRTQMSAEDLERFEAAAGDLLDELGYPRAAPLPRPEALAHAARIRDRFTLDAQARGRGLPEDW
jgi:hypothetical protein